MKVAGQINGDYIVKVSPAEMAIMSALLEKSASCAKTGALAPATAPTTPPGPPLLSGQTRQKRFATKRILPNGAEEILGPGLSTAGTPGLRGLSRGPVSPAMEPKTLTLQEAQEKTGLPYWHFRRAAINRKIPCWSSVDGFRIRKTDATKIKVAMRRLGWKPEA